MGQNAWESGHFANTIHYHRRLGFGNNVRPAQLRGPIKKRISVSGVLCQRGGGGGIVVVVVVAVGVVVVAVVVAAVEVLVVVVAGALEVVVVIVGSSSSSSSSRCTCSCSSSSSCACKGDSFVYASRCLLLTRRARSP